MIIILIITMLYSSFGQEKISTYISQRASHALGKEVRLRIEDMSLSLSHLDATIMIGEKIETKVEGFYSPFSSIYDVSYQLIGVKEDKVDIHGRVLGTMNDFTIEGEGSAFEGEVQFSGHYQPAVQKDIKVVLEKVSSVKIMQLLGKKPLLAGKISLTADIPLFSEFEKEGTIDFNLHRDGVYLKNIQDIYRVKLPHDFMLSSQGEVALGVGKHTFFADINSSVADVSIHEGSFLEANQKVGSKYHLQVKELSKLVFLTKKRYAGAFEAKGEWEYLEGLRFDGESHSLDGFLNYYYEKKKLEASLKDISLSKLFKTMSYPPIMIGKINGKADYNIEDKIALINIESKNTRFQNSSVIQKIYQTSGVDFSKELFTNTYFSSSIEEGIVSYDFKAENRESYVTLFNAKMDARKNSIRSDFDLKMQEEELSGEIYGSLKSPKVRLDMGKFLEFKAKKEIDEFFGTGTTDKVKEKLQDVDVEEIKGFFKGFF